jgi:hypothetical protein
MTLLSPNDQMEALSFVYGRAIAARAGYMVLPAEPDRDSVDLFFCAGGNMRPQIGVQFKATTAIPPRHTQFSFPVPIKNYNDLRIPTQTPRILIILELPRNSNQWLNHSAARLILKKCAYWKSLLRFPPTSNLVSVSVQIDKTDIFNVPTLIQLMDRSRNGVPL